MAGQFLLAIDGGTQSTKLSLFSTDGIPVCAVGVPLKPMDLRPGGVAEHPGDDLWDSLVEGCRALLKKWGGDPRDIRAVGLCSIRFCRCLIAANDRLAAPVLSWMDTRVSAPYRHENDAVAYVTSANGYLTVRLTGEHRDTVSNYQGQWPVDTDRFDWSADPTVFAQFGLPREMLFDLVLPGEILGTITPEAAAETGLPAGIPVAATGNDKAVEALGCNLQTDGALLSLGTYICGMIPGAENRCDSAAFWTNFACEGHRYLYECSGIRRGMWLVRQMADLFGKSEAALDERAAKVPAGSDGLLVVPEWLARPDRPWQRGVMLGFDARHGAAHIFRAGLEGILLTMQTNFAALFDAVQFTPDQLTVSGGGARSDLVMQLAADVFGLPAVRPAVTDAVGTGAAVCAAFAVGLYDSIGQAAENMVRRDRVFLPDPDNARFYKAFNETVFRNITAHTDPVLQNLHEFYRAKD